MRASVLFRVMRLLAPAMMLAGVSADAQERRPPANRPANPGRATPPKPDPARKPAAGKSTNGNPAADNPAADTPGPAGSETQAQARAKAITRAITAQEKSEKAGVVFQKFIEGTTEERVKLLAEPAKHGAEATKYFESSLNREFKPLSIQILGTVSPPSQPDRLFFPYFVATDKNQRGFVTVVLETSDGFKVDWNSFYRGHDFDLGGFLAEKKPGSTIVFLVGISKAHIFGDAPPGGEAKHTGLCDRDAAGSA